MEVDKAIQLLHRTEKVDAPPFLLTRIEARIAERLSERPSTTWVLSGVTAMVLVLAMNVYFHAPKHGGDGGEKDAIGNYASAMGLTGTNQLYQ